MKNKQKIQNADPLCNIRQFPCTNKQLLQHYNTYLSKNGILDTHNDILNKLKQVNQEALIQQFHAIIHGILWDIDSDLERYPEYSNLSHLYPIIQPHLNNNIFNSFVFTQKPKQTAIIEKMEGTIFLQVFDFVMELFEVYRQYYQIQSQDVQEAVVACLLAYTEQNPTCAIVKMDEKVGELQKNRNRYSPELKDSFVSVIQYEDEIKDTLLSQQKMQDQNTLNKMIGAPMKILEKAKQLHSNLFQKPLDINTLLYTIYERFSSSLPNSNRPNQSLKKSLKNMNTEEAELSTRCIKATVQLLNQKTAKEEILGSYSAEQRQLFRSCILKGLRSYTQKNIQNSQNIQLTQQCTRIFMNFIYQHLQGCFPPAAQQLHPENKFIYLLILLHRYCQKFAGGAYIRNLVSEVAMQTEKELHNHQLHINLSRLYKIIESHGLEVSDLRKKINEQEPEFQQQMLSSRFRPSLDMPSSSVPRDEASLEIQNLINTFYVLNKKKSGEKPIIELIKLTKSGLRKNVTILISGFLSEDSNKFREWVGIIKEMYDSEVYALRWQSACLSSMLEFIVQTFQSLYLSKNAFGLIGGPYMKAIGIARQLYNKYHENPFNPAFSKAQLAGEYLALLIENIFKGSYVNLISFSLGTELMTKTLKTMHERKKIHMVNRVIYMGGVADITEVNSLLAKINCSLKVTNVYSINDNILKYLLRVTKPRITPTGLNMLQEQEGVEIQNQDVTQIVAGHLDYRTSMQIIAKLLNLGSI